VNRAGVLRKRATYAERIPWRHFRNRNYVGYKFRRQHPLGCYVLDFYCPAAKLAIEVDGGRHNYRLGQMRDKSRSNVLADQDVIVLRFWNYKVRYELDSVLKAIWFALEKRLLSQPSPQSSPFRRDRRTLYRDDVISVAGPANAKKLLKQ